MELTTEKDSEYENLHELSLEEILNNINKEDQSVPLAVKKSIPQLEALANSTHERMAAGGRLFYIGAGTSGRLGIVDASECPPTFGVSYDMVIGIIAGGDKAIRRAVENAEDDLNQAWADLQDFNVNSKDIVVGIAASGTTPYVLGGLKAANKHGIITGCIVCNAGGPIAKAANFPVEVIVGPEFLTGSTRMKAGTAQKLVLNMLTTSVMIRLGKVKGNKMVDMQLTNNKLQKRGIKMIVKETGLDEQKAEELLNKYGSVRKAIDAGNQ
ncbi:N-acetylmuramic acid 6-phosphate etherase [Mucilaginibacter sp. L196]|uniref:N-acetylmuramic acid 6-phosphate etherase n=1 Tax=Mucilaginibacter sp. L196 TaxID=1641870 RepID=UPI00131CF0BC|nr:N-acetylmuramic acid 6-phosphate etherase [Mucilaginibacter sp. L196]